MKIIETSITIRASVDHVWMMLTDLDSYKNWNPFIVFARGHLVVGQPLWLRRAADVSILYKGMLTVINPDNHTLSWITCWITPLLLSTVYHFTLEPVDLDFIRFTQRETLSGLIPMILRPARLSTLQSYMVAANKALKRLAENKQYPLPGLWTTAS
ncbi:MAG TPA: SRPBCC domain-containing protein [Phototrophicaceae bacterium]|jgi:hypothetical protein|nr:SRPBCC domain-containing protein [Phototrophicaceae bacterium]